MSTSPRILVATDFSDTGDTALDSASRIAGMMGATLVIAHVRIIPTSAQGEGMLHAGMETNDPEVAERKLHAIQPAEEGVPVEHRLLTGDPATEILKLAESEDVWFIVMGTHGRTGLARLLMGSVAEAVVRRATCPTVLVNPSCKKPNG